MAVRNGLRNGIPLEYREHITEKASFTKKLKSAWDEMKMLDTQTGPPHTTGTDTDTDTGESSTTHHKHGHRRTQYHAPQVRTQAKAPPGDSTGLVQFHLAEHKRRGE